MDRETIDKLWHIALRQAVEDGEQYTRYHFTKLVAEHVIKDAPDYKMGYADGVAEEREQCAKVIEDWDSDSLDPRDGAAAIRARGNT